MRGTIGVCLQAIGVPLPQQGVMKTAVPCCMPLCQTHKVSVQLPTIRGDHLRPSQNPHSHSHPQAEAEHIGQGKAECDRKMLTNGKTCWYDKHTVISPETSLTQMQCMIYCAYWRAIVKSYLVVMPKGTECFQGAGAVVTSLR